MFRIAFQPAISLDFYRTVSRSAPAEAVKNIFIANQTVPASTVMSDSDDNLKDGIHKECSSQTDSGYDAHGRGHREHPSTADAISGMYPESAELRGNPLEIRSITRSNATTVLGAEARKSAQMWARVGISWSQQDENP